MEKLASSYNELELEDGQVVVYPLKPFGPGFVVDLAGRRRLGKQSAILFPIASILLLPAPYLALLLLGVYYGMVRRLSQRRVPPIPIRKWAELQGCETTRVISGLIVAGCTVLTGTCGWILSRPRTLGETLAIFAVMLVFSLGGVYGTWMFRARCRFVRR